MRIFIADNQEVVRRGLRLLLTEPSGWFVCGDTNDGQEAVTLVLELQPEIVVLDLDLPGINGIEVTRRIRDALPTTEVMFFTMHEEDLVVAEALRAGARGYVLKTDNEAKLIE